MQQSVGVQELITGNQSGPSVVEQRGPSGDGLIAIKVTVVCAITIVPETDRIAITSGVVMTDVQGKFYLLLNASPTMEAKIYPYRRLEKALNLRDPEGRDTSLLAMCYGYF